MDVKKLRSTSGAFAAIRKDGSVVTWGNPRHGADCNAPNCFQYFFLEVFEPQEIEIRECFWLIFVIHHAIVVLVLFQSVSFVNPSQVERWTNFDEVLFYGIIFVHQPGSEIEPLLRNVEEIHGTMSAFAAVTGVRVVTWGDPTNGGNSDAVQHMLTNVKQLCASEHTFGAVKADGSIVTWGGDDRSPPDLSCKVLRLEATQKGAFTAILADGEVVTWGSPEFGGDGRKVQELFRFL